MIDKHISSLTNSIKALLNIANRKLLNQIQSFFEITDFCKFFLKTRKVKINKNNFSRDIKQAFKKYLVNNSPDIFESPTEGI